MIAEFEFAHGSLQTGDDNRPNVSREVWEGLRAVLGTDALPDYDDPAPKWIWQTFVGDVEAVTRLLPRITIKRVIPHGGDLSALVAKLDRRLDGEATFNAKCNVHVPGLGLLLIDEVRLVEDCCTDALTTALENGWRIIACCPQPDQRRPDYVLGRTRPCSS